MKKRKLAIVTTLGALVILFVGFPALAPAQEGREIIGRLRNFDVYNTDRASYNDLELHFIGRIDPECIEEWYPGWGAPPKVKAGTPFGQGVTVVWANPNDPLKPRRNEHFGLNMDCDGRYEVRGGLVHEREKRKRDPDSLAILRDGARCGLGHHSSPPRIRGGTCVRAT